MFYKITQILLFFLLSTLPVLAAPPASLTAAEATAQARQVLSLHSLENQAYTVYVISDDEKFIGSDYIWADRTDEDNWRGHYYLYLQAAASPTAVQQDIYEYPVVINPKEPLKNGFYVVPGRQNLPDLLIHTEHLGGRASFDTTAYVIKNGKLQQLRYINQNNRLMYTHHARKQALHYVTDGTFAVPDYYGDHMGIETFTKVYMLDVKNLIFLYAYTINE